MENKKLNIIRKIGFKAVCLFVILFGFAFLSGCAKNQIASPSNLAVDEENKLSWDSVDEAKSYVISFYYVDKDITTEEETRKTNFSLGDLAEGDYEITIRSVPGEKKKEESLPSEKIYFHKYYETGCVYSLINNNTEYQITKVGKASGTFTIEDMYRGKAVTKIADAAFKGSTRIVNVTIGANIIEIGENAFYNCSKLEVVKLPSNVKSVGKSCFQSCRNLKEIEIPFTITEIPEFMCAYCRSLEKVTLGASITSIGESAFQDCSALKSITIPDSVKTIGTYGFSGDTLLEKVTMGSGVETIGDYGFYKCAALNEMTFAAESSLISIGEYCFSECTSLPNLVLPEGLETIGDYCFYKASALGEITIPSTVYSVGKFCFYSSKIYDDAVANKDEFYYADNWLVGCAGDTYNTITKITTETLKDTIVGISDNVFSGAPLLEEVVLPSSFRYIGKKAFYGCPCLFKFKTLDQSIEIIDDYAFANCVLTNVSFGIGLKRIGSYAFYGNSQLSNNELSPYSWIPETVTSIGTLAFKNTKLWNNPRNNDGIIYAANWVVGFTATNLGSVQLDLDTKRAAGIADYAFYNCETLQSIQGLSNCRYIGKGAFYGCTSLTSVSLNRNLTEIRDFTFYKCSSLIKVTMPRTLTSIGNYAFFKCSLLSSVDLASTNCATIGKSAFHSDENLKEITFGTKLTTIGDYAFYKCTAIPSITLSENVKTIGLKTFYKCEALTSVTFNENLEEIGESAFNSCISLTALTIPSKVTTIGKSAFYKCSKVETLVIGESVQTIGDYAFYGFELITKLDIPASVTSIGNYAFKGASSLTSIVLPETVKVIGQHAFYGCKQLTIYTTATTILGEWHNRFNSSYRPIFWGVTLDENNNVKEIQLSSDLFDNKNAANGISAPLADGQTFESWKDENGNTYSMGDLINLEVEGKLTAIYK